MEASVSQLLLYCMHDTNRDRETLEYGNEITQFCKNHQPHTHQKVTRSRRLEVEKKAKESDVEKKCE